MALGDITVAVNPDGWSANLTIEGFASGATYAFGLTGNNVPGASTPYFAVVSLGYDATGAATTISRTVHLTNTIRFPYSTGYLTGTYAAGTFVDGETVTQAVSGATAIVVGNQASGARLVLQTVTGTLNNVNICTGGTSGATFTSASTFTAFAANTPNELVSATGMTVRVNLSEYIYQKDNTGGGNSGTAPTITIPASFAINTGGGAQASATLSAAAVTQSSTQAYPAVIARFVTLPFKLLNSSFAVECVAFQRHARDGKPVAAVKFTLADGTVTRAQTVSAMTKSTDTDALPVYAAADLASNFTQSANVTCRIEVFPWVGDSASVRDSSANAFPSRELANLPVGVCDKNGTYGVTYCAVDAGTGSDANTTAYTSQAAAEAGSKTATMGRALKNIQDYNNTNYARNTVDAGVVLLVGGSHLNGRGSHTINTNSACAVTITRASATTRANAQITGFNATSRECPRNTRFYDLSIVPSSSANQQIGWGNNAAATIMVEDVTATGTGAATKMFDSASTGNPTFWWKNITMTGYTTGLDCGNGMVGMLARSCVLTPTSSSATAFGNVRCVVGNRTVSATSCCGLIITSWADNGNVVFAYNRGYALTGGGFYVAAGTYSDVAEVGNVWERIGADPTALSEVSDCTLTNFLSWHNTHVGERTNWQNDIVAPYVNKVAKLISAKYNSTQWLTFKGDVFDLDGAIVGWWPVDFGVGFAGSNSATGGTFDPDFSGLYNTRGIASGYTLDKSKTGTNTGTGDYIPTVASTLLNRVPSGQAVIPWDLAGTAISNTGAGAAGAYQIVIIATSSSGNYNISFSKHRQLRLWN